MPEKPNTIETQGSPMDVKLGKLNYTVECRLEDVEGGFQIPACMGNLNQEETEACSQIMFDCLKTSIKKTCKNIR